MKKRTLLELTFIASVLGATWTKPIIESAILPAHAGTSTKPEDPEDPELVTMCLPVGTTRRTWRTIEVHPDEVQQYLDRGASLGECPPRRR